MKTIFSLILQASLLTLLLVSSAAMAQTKGGGDVKKDILGTWEGFMANSDGSRYGDIKLVITEDTVTASNPRGGQIMGAGTYKISGLNKKLPTIDAKGTSGQFAGKSYEGVFSIDGKTLKWCSANDHARSRRPNELQTNVQAGQFLMVLEKK